MKKDILFIVDSPNWAYYEIFQFVKKHLGNSHNFYVDFTLFNLRNSAISDTKKKIKHNHNIIYSTLIYTRNYLNKIRYRKIRDDRKYDLIIYMGWYMDIVADLDINYKKICKGIFTEGFPPKGLDYDEKNNLYIPEIGIQDFINAYLANCDAVVCGNETIAHFYREFHPRVYNANSCFDISLFCKKNEIKKKGDFIIGWTGNPNRKFKGYHNYIVPAIEEFSKEKPDVKFKTRFKGSIKKLASFYNDVDVVIIASDADAGPNLFLEASLSSVPSISTKIGFPRLVINDGANGFFIQKDIGDIVQKLEILYKDRLLLQKMSQRIRQDFIEVLGPDIQKKRWVQLFEEVL